MSQPFVGEVRLVGFNFGPVDWMICQGQILSISEYSTLFNLIGTTYGGNGQTTFALPNLQSTIPVHQGNGYVMGQTGGVEQVTILAQQYPTHSHNFVASTTSTGGVASPGNNTVAAGVSAYRALIPTTSMNAGMVSIAQGGSQPHANIQPYLTLNWIISLYGVYPTQS